MHNVDSALSLFLQSSDEAERDRLIEDIILVHAAPIVRLILRRRLSFYVSQSGVNPNNPEATDLYQEIIFKIFQRLHDLHSQSQGAEIKDFPGYVNQVTTNACNDYLRIKSPARYRLKNRIRYLLIEHRDFQKWQIGKRTLCGFAGWERREDVAADAADEEEIEEISDRIRAGRFTGVNPDEISLPLAVAEIFRWLDKPLELEILVSLAAKLLETKEIKTDSLEEIESQPSKRLLDPYLDADLRLQGKEKLQQVWNEILKLSPIERQIVFLTRNDDLVEDLWSLFLEADVLTVSEMAKDLEISVERFMSLWKQIPMDVASVANVLGLSRQKVIKLKHFAKKQLRKRLSDS